MLEVGESGRQLGFVGKQAQHAVEFGQKPVGEPLCAGGQLLGVSTAVLDQRGQFVAIGGHAQVSGAHRPGGVLACSVVCLLARASCGLLELVGCCDGAGTLGLGIGQLIPRREGLRFAADSVALPTAIGSGAALMLGAVLEFLRGRVELVGFGAGLGQARTGADV
jgi:hypothetical protein